MSDALQISIIVPVYNTAPYLQRCVGSIIMQTYPHLEILLINDGSTDDSAALCDAICKKDSRVQVIHKPKNEGLSAARNTGLDMASGEWIGFVDSDDWIAPDMYETLLHTLIALDTDVVYGGIVPTGEDSVSESDIASNAHILSEKEYFRDFFRMGTQSCIFYVWNALYRRSLLEGIRFREEIRNAEDVDFTFRVALSARRIARDERARYFYYQNPQSITRRGLSKTDFDLIPVWDYIVTLCRYERPDLLPAAELNRQRVDFTLLMRLILYCPQEQDTQYALQERVLLDSLRKSRRSLLHAPIPLSRKILLLCMCAQYPMTKRVLRFVRTISKRWCADHA